MKKLTSCIPQEPFVKLDEEGQASILNYNLPQSTCYDATCFLGLDLRSNLFKITQKRQPVRDYWDFVGSLNKDDLLSRINSNSPLLPNLPVIQTYQPILNLPLPSVLATRPTLSAVSTRAVSDQGDGSANDDKQYLVAKIQDGFMPVLSQRFSRLPEWVYIPKPTKADPQISIILHLKMCSYLGDYGAGRTLKTFSLLPGEKSTISIRSYQYQEIIKERTQNVLDSYSESSAEDLQSSIEQEVEVATNLSKTDTYSKTGSWKAGGSAGLNLGFFKIGGGGGGGGSSSTSTTVNQAIQTQVGILVNNTSRHTAKSDSLREIEVNTSTSSTSVSETEKVITRNLENVNKSRVLNFVFRQLLQEFISITYIDDVSFVYSTGFPSQRKSCKLSNLDDMLAEILTNQAAVNEVKNQIYAQLCSLADYQGTQHSLIEKVSQKLQNCINPDTDAEPIEYVRRKQDLSQTYKGKTVNGIIVDVSHRILRTPSVVVDALLGQGEALDCYNMQLQDAAVVQAGLENKKLEEALQIIGMGEDPVVKANLYQKIFGDCCEKATEEETA